MSHSNTHSCTICGAYTQDMLCGNRLLVHAHVHQPPAEHSPTLLWRCGDHQHYTLRTAEAVRATEAGDVLFILTCRHEICWICRGRNAYTPAKLQHVITTRQIRLDQPQRCYVCGDLEREREADL
jgi:hypothetical protein